MKKKQKDKKHKEKAALIIGGGLLQVPIIKQAKANGYKILVADRNPACLAAPLADVLLDSLGPSDHDIKQLLNQLQPYADQLALCLTVGTDFSLVMAHVNEYFSLTGIKPAAAKVTTHKGNMRRFLRSYHFLQPDFFVTDNIKQAKQWLTTKPQKGYVIKPTLNMGARGVMYFENEKELDFAFEYAMRYASNKEVIIEDFIEAHEFSIDALVVDGKVFECGFADRIIERKDQRFFIENGHSMPSQYSNEIKKAVTFELQKFANALHEHSGEKLQGALKGDIRFTADKKIIIGEIASRLSGGFMSTHTYPMASENNLMQGFIEVLENKTPQFLKENQNSTYKKVVIERSLYVPAGTITKLKIPSSVKDQLDFFHLNYQEGDTFLDLQNNVGKVGHFVLSEKDLSSAEKLWQKLRSQIIVTTQLNPMSWQQLRPSIKEKMKKDFCYVCKECDGEHCASGVPGMGAVTNMSGFTTNLKDIARYKILPVYLNQSYEETYDNKQKSHKNKFFSTTDISFSFANKRFSAPITNAPITGSITNLGGSISEWELACETGYGMHSLEMLPFFGDGAGEDKFHTALAVIRLLQVGVPFFKPRKEQKQIQKRIEWAEEAGATAWGMDIDSIALQTMKNKNVAMERKSLGDLKELKKTSSLPFIVKGVLTLEDTQIAAEAGASAIIISNHGGRIINSLPSAIQVLPTISSYVKKNFPHLTIFADGGIRSGEDIYKFLALGANAISIGRPLAIAAVGGGRNFVSGLVLHYQKELMSLMKINGFSNIAALQNSLQPLLLS